MNDLIPVSFENEEIRISARDLHEFLEVKTNFRDWFPRMTEYDLEEGRDFNPLKIERVQIEGSREVTRVVPDYQLTVEAAKHIAMIQRNEKGKMARKYFIEIEEQWNSPDQVIARALIMSNNKNLELQEKIKESEPKVKFYDQHVEAKNAVKMQFVAKSLNIPGIGRNKLFRILKEKRILMNNNEPYQEYINRGYFRLKLGHYEKNGTVIQSFTTLVLPKGQEFIANLINKEINNANV